MPSKEWLAEHTKVQAYLDDDLSTKLQAWMKEKNITQLSQAVVTILKHYLDDHPPSEVSHQLLVEEVETLKEEMNYIKTCLLEAGAKSLAPKIPENVVIFPSEPIEIDQTDEEKETGLTKTELCSRIGLTPYQADKAAKEQQLSTNDYLLKITGWKPGEGKRPKYYPANETIESKKTYEQFSN